MIRIGSWVRRGPNRPGHIVESLVADDVIVRCGKRMAVESSRGELEVYDGPVSRASVPLDWRLCLGGCQRFGGG